ncbi:MAG: aminotransferase class I/II-fold pyridoxal phosphate-dependent enzyme [Lachnospiraceae bacterium]|nr:aminotransferase class I/II-fold pyridoxal phosphate-dependent enzyme [Lachnospiraceae bacterium]
MTGYRHGGDIYRNKVDIDCSVSINPMDWPYELKQRIGIILGDMSNIHTYPDITYDGLRAAVARYTDEPLQSVVCGNGASELISSICNLVSPRRLMLTAPCYSGYERAAAAAGADVLYAYTDGKKGYADTDVILECLEGHYGSFSNEDTDMIIIGNPSNPAGSLIPVDIYEKIVRLCEEKGIVLIVDECFVELSMSSDEYRSTYSCIRGSTLIRLRALTKSFRLAGLRLGYALFEDEDLAGRLYDFMPEWNVSTVAMKIGTTCLEYECSLNKAARYMNASYEYIKRERKRVSDTLKGLGIRVFDSSVNYILIYSDTDLYEELLNKKILIRDCKNIVGLNKGYFRISLRDTEDNDKLIESIRSVIKSL